MILYSVSIYIFRYGEIGRLRDYKLHRKGAEYEKPSRVMSSEFKRELIVLSNLVNEIALINSCDKCYLHKTIGCFHKRVSESTILPFFFVMKWAATLAIARVPAAIPA